MKMHYAVRRRQLLSRLAVLLLIAAPSVAIAQCDCTAYAGIMSVDVGLVCLQNGQAMLAGTPSNDAVMPPGYASTYILTRTNSLIIEQMGPSPSFLVHTEDVWRIHRLISNPADLDLGFVQFGSTSAYDLYAMLTQGGGSVCGSISMTNAAVKTMACEEPCNAFASGMAMDTTTVCLTQGQATLTAVPSGTSMVPAGFQVEYLLTRTNGLIIEQLSATPSFTVNSVDVWRIHNLVYNPATLDLGTINLGTTTAYELQSTMLQGGGPICASLDISGAPVKTGECGTPCTADAGTSSADQPDLCLSEGIAELTATPTAAATVPPGYELAYFLSEGNDQVIQQTGPLPQFTVENPGSYTIHALVYNPLTLSFSGISLGTTSIAGLNALLMQGGGGICASLELQGAYFQVVDCTPACTADAGSMLSESPDACLLNGSATLAGISYGDTLVPEGYTLGYLLSYGQVLVEMGGQPLFTVHEEGSYRIHAFVYDPATIGSLGIQWGATSIFELSSQLVQGGGPVCAGLDVLGTAFIVTPCAPACSAGTDTTVTACLTDTPFELFSLLGGNPCPNGTWTTAADPEVSGTFDPASDPAGVYFYTVMVPGGTMDTSTVSIYVFECPELLTSRLEVLGGDQTANSTGINCPPDLSKQHAIHIWPNPAIGTVHMTLPFTLGAHASVELIDATGRTIQPVKLSGNATTLDLDVSLLSPGLWTVRITDGTKVVMGRFVRNAP